MTGMQFGLSQNWISGSSNRRFAQWRLMAAPIACSSQSFRSTNPARTDRPTACAKQTPSSSRSKHWGSHTLFSFEWASSCARPECVCNVANSFPISLRKWKILGYYLPFNIFVGIRKTLVTARLCQGLSCNCCKVLVCLVHFRPEQNW
jgi:hypothetical protein